MADFKDVVGKWSKVCEDFYDEEGAGCSGCPVQEWGCPPIIGMSEENLAKAEEFFMNYNRPIYPTILELVHYIANRLPARNDGKDWARDIPISELVMERIPDDVAEEFELVPINECGLRKYVENDDIPPSEWR